MNISLFKKKARKKSEALESESTDLQDFYFLTSYVFLAAEMWD